MLLLLNTPYYIYCFRATPTPVDCIRQTQKLTKSMCVLYILSALANAILPMSKESGYICPTNECHSPLPYIEPGCSQCHRGITMGDWRDPLDPDLDAQILFSQFLKGRQSLIKKYSPGQPASLTQCRGCAQWQTAATEAYLMTQTQFHIVHDVCFMGKRSLFRKKVYAMTSVALVNQNRCE